MTCKQLRRVPFHRVERTKDPDAMDAMDEVDDDDDPLFYSADDRLLAFLRRPECSHTIQMLRVEISDSPELSRFTRRLGGMTGLIELDLHCSFCPVYYSLHALMASVAMHTQLEDLCLSWCASDDESVYSLEALRGLDRLRSLWISSWAGSFTLKLLPRLASLTKLRVGDNVLLEEMEQGLSTVTDLHVTSRTRFDMSPYGRPTLKRVHTQLITATRRSDGTGWDGTVSNTSSIHGHLDNPFRSFFFLPDEVCADLLTLTYVGNARWYLPCSFNSVPRLNVITLTRHEAPAVRQEQELALEESGGPAVAGLLRCGRRLRFEPSADSVVIHC